MNKEIAFLFPGQGAQYVGMAKDFFDQFAIARHTFEEADELLKRDFSSLIFNGPAQELVLTKNSQLAIYIVSVAIWRSILGQFPALNPTVCAGLSLGEYTALTAAKKISFVDCLPVVAERGAAMQAACEAHPGTMQVVLALEPEQVQAVVSKLNPPHPIWVANLNCPGQVVIAGTAEALSLAAAPLKEMGAKRILPLDVSGAFHSGLMSEAQARLEPLLSNLALCDSSISIVMNAPGGYVASLNEIRKWMISQVTHPVLWEKGIREIAGKGVSLAVEMGPGKTLQGMNTRIKVPFPTISVEKVADLDELAKGIGVSDAIAQR